MAAPISRAGVVPRRLTPLRLLAMLGVLVFAFAALLAAAPAANAASGPTLIITVDHAGAPVANVSMTVMDSGQGKTVVTTDPQGKATVSLKKSGKYAIFFNAATLPQDSAPETNPINRSTYGPVSPQNTLVEFTPTGTRATVTPTPFADETKAEDKASGSTQKQHSQSLVNNLLTKIGTGLTFGLLLALAAVGLSLIYGTTGLNNFAHGELVTFGSFVGFVFIANLQWSGWLGIVMALLFGAAFGWLQDAGLWRPLRKRRVGTMQVMIVSIGLSLVLRYLFAFIFGPNRLALPTDAKAILVIGPMHFSYWDVFGSIIAIVLLLLVAFFLMFTKLGKATRAVADNKALAAATGINVERVIRIVWIGGGALAAVSGVLIGYYQTLSWNTGASILLLLFAAVTLGGLGTTFGALVGAIIIGLAMDVSTVWIPADFKFIIAMGIMILVLLVRPQGILGKKQRIG